MLVPSWEWGFRVLREAVKTEGAGVQSFVLKGEDQVVFNGLNAAAAGPLLDVCFLAPGDSVAEAASRWLAAEALENPPKRSLAICVHRLVICLGAVATGSLRDDLRRLALAQRCRCFLGARRGLSLAESRRVLEVIQSFENERPLLERVHALMVAQPGLWRVDGVLW